MIKDFGNKIAFDLFHEGECRLLPRSYWKRAIFLMDVMHAVENFDEPAKKSFPPNIRLHLLKQDLDMLNVSRQRHMAPASANTIPE